MDSRYIFLREDFDALNQAITDNGSRVRVSLEQTGCSQDGGDTWHDNFEYEEGQRGAAMWSQRVKRLNEIRAHAELFVPDPTGSQVFLGRTVTVEDQSTS